MPMLTATELTNIETTENQASHRSGNRKRTSAQPDAASITVGISTRNRLDSLVRCIQSIDVIADLVVEIIVVDDFSDEPIRRELLHEIPTTLSTRLSISRHDKNLGYIVARNTIAKITRSEFILSLD